jgi:hypothetical protein
MAVTSVTAIVKGFVVDGSTPANNNTFYLDFFGNDGSYSSSVVVNADITQTAQQVADALATAVATAVNTALGTSLTSNNVLMLTRPSAGVGTLASGDIASGSIGAAQIASGGLGSGAIGSGQIGSTHIASGAIRSGHIGDAAVTSGSYASGSIASGHMASGFIAALGSVALTSGQVTSGFLGDASVVSGSIASGQIASGHLASGLLSNIGGGSLTSGSVTSGFLGNASVVSGSIASGVIGNVHVASGGLTSGALASGSIYSPNFASGALIAAAELVVDDDGITAETISGGRCVAYNSSGLLVIAMANIPSRMPAMGVSIDNALSGQPLRHIMWGEIESPQFNFSGGLGQPVWVGLSGVVEIAQVSLSGALSQMIGVAATQTQVCLGHRAASGYIQSEEIGAAVVYPKHFGVNAINQISGNVTVSSGMLLVAGSGAFSGTLFSNKYVMGFDLSLNPVVGNQSVIMTWWGMQLRGNQQSTVDVASGQVEPIGGNADFSVGIPIQKPGSVGLAVISASGQTGDLTAWFGSGGRSGGALGTKFAAINASGEFRGLLASGVVLSGAIASGQIGKFHFASGGIVQSGSVGSGAIQGQRGGGSINIASGSLGNFDFGSGAIQSGSIASGQIGQFHIANEAVRSGNVGSGQIASGHLASGFIANLASTVTSGQIVSGLIGNAAVVSGSIASGQVGLIHLNSGLQQTLVQYLTDTPGAITNLVLDQSFICAELISGLKAVAFESGGSTIVRATWGSGLRLPAIGVTISGAVSGTACTVRRYGMVFENVSGQIASGFAGRGLYVGSGGLIVNLSGYVGGVSSGAGPGQLSGTATQIIGQAMSGGIMVVPDRSIRSGLVTIAGISY